MMGALYYFAILLTGAVLGYYYGRANGHEEGCRDTLWRHSHD